MLNTARRAWLKGDFKLSRPAIRPPGAGSESRFTESCTRCDACLRACPLNLLKRGEGGFPEIQFQRNGCNFCGDCARACADGVLQPGLYPWNWRISVNEQCLSQRGITCRSCGEHCESAALRFRLAVGGIAQLETDTLRCTGCGDCIRVCPTAALRLQPLNQAEILRHGDGHD